MICPHCHVPMIVVEHNKIELDYCTKCEGVWFDSGELELLLHSLKLPDPEKVVGEILAEPEVKSSHQERKCPVCGRRMKEIAVGSPQIYIDICREGDGIWFDGGEVNQLIGQLTGQTPQKENSRQQIAAFLDEVFRAKDSQ
jgi:Zn-finger nucleic acid-binding protein